MVQFKPESLVQFKLKSLVQFKPKWWYSWYRNIHDALAKQALVQYQPIVEQFINENCQDGNKICYTLDFMLDFCFDPNMLLLYRNLCRHLYGIDPSAAADYVIVYKEMWDEEGKQFGGNKKNLS